MGKFRKIQTDIEIINTPERVFDALITPSDICRWWEADRAIVIPDTNGVWVASWGSEKDNPDYISAASISVFKRPERLILSDFKYYTRFKPLEFDADFETEFKISATINGALLDVVQSGFPEDKSADEFFQACRVGWVNTLKNLKQYLE